MGGKEECFSFFGRGEKMEGKENGVGDFSPCSQNISPPPPPQWKEKRGKK